MINHPVEICFLEPLDQLLGAKGALAGGAPDVDATGVQNQDPEVQTPQFPSERVEAELVIGADEDVGIASRARPKRKDRERRCIYF